MKSDNTHEQLKPILEQLSDPFKALAMQRNCEPSTSEFSIADTSQPKQSNVFYQSYLHTPPILVVHNMLNYGLGSKKDVLIKARNRFDHQQHIRSIIIECSLFKSETDCCNALYKIINMAKCYYDVLEFTNKNTADVRTFIEQVRTSTDDVRPVIFVLNDIDTPYLKEHREYFLQLLPSVVSISTSSRFILNTNSVDGPLLFSVNELIQMRIVLNTTIGRKWANEKWFVDFIPTAVTVKKKTKATINVDNLRRLSPLQKSICVILMDNNGVSESDLLEKYRITFEPIQQSSFNQALKKMKEIGTISIVNGLVTLLIKKEKLQRALSLV